MQHRKRLRPHRPLASHLVRAAVCRAHEFAVGATCMTAVVALAAGVLALAAPQDADAANVDQFSYRGWQGWAHVADGEFRHCVVSGGYSDGMTLSFFYDDNGFKVAVRRPGWELEPGSVYGVRVSVNPGLSGRVPGVAARGDSLLMPMSALERPVTHMRRGYTLALDVDGLDRLTFDLTGTSVALQRLIDCYGANS